MRTRLWMVGHVVLSTVAFAGAQDAVAPAGTQPQPAAAPGEYFFQVVEVRGSVTYAPAGTDAKAVDAWKPLVQGMEVRPGTLISTSMRGRAKLVQVPADPPSVVMVLGNTLYSLDRLERKTDAQGAAVVEARVSLAYGGVRAGVAETSTRSDLEIAAPVATLAKKGTWDFQFTVEPGTGNFNISLAERGIVQALQAATGQRITVLPGQFVNQFMSRWIETVAFNSPVNVQDWYGLQGAELAFSLMNQTGLGALGPNGDQASTQALVGGSGEGGGGGGVIGGTEGIGTGNLLQPGPQRRPEGNFGIGQGFVPILPGASNPLIQKARIGQFPKPHVCAHSTLKR